MQVVVHLLTQCGVDGKYLAHRFYRGRIMATKSLVLQRKGPFSVSVHISNAFHSKGLHNFTHPRTDAVVIMIAIDETGEKVLLGRGVSFYLINVFYLY